MSAVTITAQQVIAQVNAELEAIDGFQKNIDQHMEALSNAQEEDHMVALAKGIAFNKRWIQIHTERAIAVLTLVGYFKEDHDEPTLEVIRNILAIIQITI